MSETQNIEHEIDIIGTDMIGESQMTQSTQGILRNIDQLLQPSNNSTPTNDGIVCELNERTDTESYSNRLSAPLGNNVLVTGNTYKELEPTSTQTESHDLAPSNPAVEQSCVHTEAGTYTDTAKSAKMSAFMNIEQSHKAITSEAEQGLNISVSPNNNQSMVAYQAVYEDHSHSSRLKISSANVEYGEPAEKKKKLSDSVTMVTVSNVPDSSVTVLPEAQSSVNIASESLIYASSRIQAFTSNGKFGLHPKLLGLASEEFTEENYLRGCKWSPDGSCILTATNDNHLRVFNAPSVGHSNSLTDRVHMSSVLQTREGDTIYDYCWYNKMTFDDLDSRCFVSSCRQCPIHMWDAVTGELKCTYRAYDHLDEITAAYSLTFSLDGTKLYGGYNKMIRVFDTSRPGRQFQSRPTFTGKVGGQPGIISCMAASPQGGGLYGAGSYSRGIALYYEPAGDMVCVFEGQQGGVTHILFSPDGTKLYSGGRKDPEILCWDLRKPGQILFVAYRHVETNQRMYFDQDPTGQYLFSTNHNGHIYVWDTYKPPVQKSSNTDFSLEPISIFKAHSDVANGVSVHPTLPLLVTSSGQRHYPQLGDSDSDTDSTEGTDTVENTLKVWSYQDS